MGSFAWKVVVIQMVSKGYETRGARDVFSALICGASRLEPHLADVAYVA